MPSRPNSAVYDLNTTDDIVPNGGPRNLTYHYGPGAISTQTSGGEVHIGKYTGYLTDALTVSALVGAVNDNVLKTTGARTANQTCPVVLDTNPLTAGWSLGAKVTHRKVNNGMDDYCSHLGFEKWAEDNKYTNFDSSTMAQCILVNPGNDVNLQVDVNNDGKLKAVTIPAKYLGLAKYTRTYTGLELTLDRPFNGKWGFNASYTLSKTKGTAEGYVNSVINQEDAGVTQDFDFGSLTDGSDGYLANDRRHVFKAYGNYAFTPEWRVGFNATVSSGRPLNCIGFVPATVPDYEDARNYTTASSYYCLGTDGKSHLIQRGTVGRTSWSGSLDLQLAYIPTMSKGKLTFQADVFNVFNSLKATELNETRDYSRDTVAEGKLNPNYLRPTSFQTPRSVRLTARYEF